MPLIFYKILGGAAVIAFCGFLGWSVVNKYNTAIEEAQNAKADLKTAEDANRDLAISLVEKDFNVQIEQRERRELEDKYRKSDEKVQKLESLFSNHDLGNLYDKKPNLILNRVNDGTKRVLEETARIINGSEINPED